MLHQLYVPTLDEVCVVLQDFFKTCFETVSCKVVDCPDLSKEPYWLSTKGICGSPTLCDIGSFSHLLPLVNKEKRYDLVDVLKATKIDSGSLMGAGAGPFHVTGMNSEMVAELSYHAGQVTNNGSYYGSYDKEKHLPVSTKMETTKFTLFAQLLLSEGKGGQVIELKAAKRTRDGEFGELLRDALSAKYKDLKQPVGLGGVVIQEAGKSKFHIIPEFSSEPLDCAAKVKEWLKFFEMDPPVIAVGTALSHDPQRLDLRLEHFHCFNQSRSLAGHCHFDVNAAEAVYKAYLIVGHHLLRIDQPK